MQIVPGLMFPRSRYIAPPSLRYRADMLRLFIPIMLLTVSQVAQIVKVILVLLMECHTVDVWMAQRGVVPLDI